MATQGSKLVAQFPPRNQKEAVALERAITALIQATKKGKNYAGNLAWDAKIPWLNNAVHRNMVRMRNGKIVEMTQSPAASKNSGKRRVLIATPAAGVATFDPGAGWTKSTERDFQWVSDLGMGVQLPKSALKLTEAQLLEALRRLREGTPGSAAATPAATPAAAPVAAPVAATPATPAPTTGGSLDKLLDGWRPPSKKKIQDGASFEIPKIPTADARQLAHYAAGHKPDFGDPVAYETSAGWVIGFYMGIGASGRNKGKATMRRTVPVRGGRAPAVAWGKTGQLPAAIQTKLAPLKQAFVDWAEAKEAAAAARAAARTEARAEAKAETAAAAVAEPQPVAPKPASKRSRKRKPSAAATRAAAQAAAADALMQQSTSAIFDDSFFA